jgi:hypothetical protein
MMTHFVGSPFSKFASWKFVVNELNRYALFETLKPDWPAVAVDDLRPDDRRACGLERAVVLRAALEVLRVVGRGTDRLMN